jgi:hypothetical protein
MLTTAAHDRAAGNLIVAITISHGSSGYNGGDTPTAFIWSAI